MLQELEVYSSFVRVEVQSYLTEYSLRRRQVGCTCKIRKKRLSWEDSWRSKVIFFSICRDWSEGTTRRQVFRTPLLPCLKTWIHHLNMNCLLESSFDWHLQSHKSQGRTGTLPWVQWTGVRPSRRPCNPNRNGIADRHVQRTRWLLDPFARFRRHSSEHRRRKRLKQISRDLVETATYIELDGSWVHWHGVQRRRRKEGWDDILVHLLVIEFATIDL
jgi:hypothetical protein